jgi:hypothetical protein
MSYGADWPSVCEAIPRDEWDRRIELSTDQCIIDHEHFFVRGCLEIPLIEKRGDVFVWGVWVSLSQSNFDRVHTLWHTAGREREHPYFGWLCTALPCYSDTMYLKTDVQTRPVGERPLVKLQPCDHALYAEQRDGITMDRVQEFAEQILHA